MNNRRRTLNDIISTIFLLNVGTVPTVWYIFFHFIICYEKNPAELQLLKKYGCDRLPSLKSSKWNTTELISNGDMFQPHLKYTLKCFYNTE
jgi:hypothetical protein